MSALASSVVGAADHAPDDNKLTMDPLVAAPTPPTIEKPRHENCLSVIRNI